MKKAPGKAPSIQWYYKDWLSDRRLQMATPATRGIWMNLLMYMTDCSLSREDECEGGQLSLTIRRLCQLGACTVEEAGEFIDEGLELSFCEIEVVTCNAENANCNADLIIIRSRRLTRDARVRDQTRKRVREWRAKQAQVGAKPNVTQPVTPTRARPTPTPTPTGKKKTPIGVSKKRATKKPARPWPHDFELSGKQLDFALAKGMTRQQAQVEWETFYNHAVANDRRQVDWPASWRTWVLRSADYKPRTNGNGYKPQPRTRGERNVTAAKNYLRACEGQDHDCRIDDPSRQLTEA